MDGLSLSFKPLSHIKVLLRALIPLFIGGGLVWLLTRFTDLEKVGSILQSFPAKVNILIFFFLVLYFSFKFLTTFLWVKYAKLPITLGLIATIFAGGELAREIPIAIIFPALAIWKKEKFGLRILAIPFLQVTLEFAAALFLLAIFGLGQFKIFHFIGIAGILSIITFLIIVNNLSFLIENFLKLLSFLPFVKRVHLEFFPSLRNLVSIKPLVRFFALALIYQLFLAIVFYEIILALGVKDITFTEAVSVFAANFVAAVISPLPFDLGVTESSGFLILTSFGQTPEIALSIMFANRAVVALSSWFLFGIIVAATFFEIRKFFFEKR